MVIDKLLSWALVIVASNQPKIKILLNAVMATLEKLTYELNVELSHLRGVKEREKPLSKTTVI